MAEDLHVLVLQAPVSDREVGPKSGVGLEVVTEVRALVGEGKGQVISYSLHVYGFIPLSAPRALDLFDRLGADDTFSADMTEYELASRLGYLAIQHVGGSIGSYAVRHWYRLLVNGTE